MVVALLMRVIQGNGLCLLLIVDGVWVVVVVVAWFVDAGNDCQRDE